MDKEDFEDCLVDYMEMNFGIMIEDKSAKEVNDDSLIRSRLEQQ